MHSAFVPFRSSQVHYSYAGSGSNLLVCLHGYGESGASFLFLEPYLRDYTIIGIDMPFHGKTQWKEGWAFTVEDLRQIIDSIFADRNVAGASFTVAGYSMGARISLHLLQHIPHRIKKIVLLAPDGLKENFWYWLATQTRVGNLMFHYTMQYPQWLFMMMRLAKNIGIINKSVYKFARHHIHDKSMRRLLYLRWTGMRRFRPSLQQVKTVVQQYAIPVHLLFWRPRPHHHGCIGRKVSPRNRIFFVRCTPSIRDTRCCSRGMPD